jgi:methionyl aminopeptidase
MVTLKSPREIETMRRSGKITSAVLTALMKAARPGMTTGELDAMAERGIRAAGGIPTFKGYNGFAGSICASINDEVVHGIPGSRVLRDGDLLSIDIGTTLDGYVSDSAVTIAIGTVPQAAQQLLEVTRECLTIGIAQMVRGKRVGDIGAAVQAHAERHGFGVRENPSATAPGAGLHEGRSVPTTASRGTGWSLAGLGLATAPMITRGGPAVRISARGRQSSRQMVNSQRISSILLPHGGRPKISRRHCGASRIERFASRATARNGSAADACLVARKRP